MALLATVTSLSELATGISGVAVANVPNMVVGDALGSCVVNLVFLVVIDSFFRKEPVWYRASQGHVLAGALGVVMLGFVLIGLLMSQFRGSAVSPSSLQLGFALTTPVLLALYLMAMRTVFVYERQHAPAQILQLDVHLPTLRSATIRFVLAAGVVAGAGIWLPFVATTLAHTMGWNKSFVGSLFVALATSLPELAVTISALSIGALDMAIANLLGSNLFNVAIIAVDDIFLPPRSLARGGFTSTCGHSGIGYHYDRASHGGLVFQTRGPRVAFHQLDQSGPDGNVLTQYLRALPPW